MKKKVNQVLITIYALWCWLANHMHRMTVNKNVIIIFQQIFGDSVFLVPMLKGFEELYPKSLGYKVTLICRPAIADFLRDVALIPSGICIETLDYTKYLYNLSYFKTITKRYRFSTGISIVPGTSISAEIFSSTLCSKERYGQMPFVRRTHPWLMALFQRIAYNKAVVADEGTTTILQKQKLMKYLGLPNYEAKLTRLKPQERMIKGKYCVVCPGTSMTMKMWPIDRFVNVIDYIVDKFNIDIYLCGGKGEEHFGNIIKERAKHPQRIYNMIGVTSYKEWASIIEYSLLVFGNDSATVHIGVGYQKPVICINGLYEKGIMYPYQVEELEEDEKLPVIISLDKYPCEYCRTKGYFAGYGNSKCLTAIKAGKCALCIEEISAERVKEAINKEIQIRS